MQQTEVCVSMQLIKHISPRKNRRNEVQKLKWFVNVQGPRVEVVQRVPCGLQPQAGPQL